MPYIGDSIEDIKVCINSGDDPFPFVGATVRWWLSKAANGPPAFGPVTVSDTAPNDFAAGIIYPTMSADDTDTMSVGDYTLAIEIKSGSSVRTLFDVQLSFHKRGL